MELWREILTLTPVPASALIRILGHEDVVPVPVERIVEQLGIALLDAEIDSDGILKIEKETAQIIVNNDVSNVRRRFTIAHELAHLCLGHIKEGTIHRDESIFANVPRERAANQFAARLLMPEHIVRITAVEANSLDELASFFHVSKPAMNFRLAELGIRL